MTITDHARSRAQAIDHLEDTFISEELTVGFKGELQAVHVLCYGITAEDHDWLRERLGDQATFPDGSAAATSREPTRALTCSCSPARLTPSVR